MCSSLTDQELVKGVIAHPLGGIHEAVVHERVEALWPQLAAWLDAVGFDGRS